MRFYFAALVIASALTEAAHAADKPIIGPVPAWVKPVALPPIKAKASDEAPVRILLSDQQMTLERGRQTVFSETALRIQTPQGLAAGNISLPWQPDTDILTVHKLLIQRGDQIIDVLKSGQTFTVLRREQNLENATLDGVLTANIQPEGLQVGDVLDFALSVTSSDPTLKGHVEQIAAAWNGFTIDRAHLRMQWPSSLPARIRTTAALPALKPAKTGDVNTVEFSLDDVQPIVPPKGAPPRYQIGRMVELTDYASWADLGTLMAPLYKTAASIPAQGPLRAELERIQKLSPDAKVRAEAALALVQDRVRYVALAMGAGGYVPADAETTWSRRFGDCKGKTALLLALLHAMGMEAEPVIVSTTFGDGLDARLPMVTLFNHVLVRASIGGRTYWLDGTRTGDTDLDRLITPDFGWGLPLLASNAALVRMVPVPLASPTQETAIRIDASAGITAPAPAKVETILRGDDAIGTNAALANLVGEARDRALKDYWKGQYDFIDVKSASATFDPKTGEQRLTMEGVAKMDWSGGAYQTDGTGIGYRADFSRDPGPDRDAPFAVAYPTYSRTTETIVLPKGRGEFKLGTALEVDQTIAGIQYRRHAAIKDDIFTIEKTERSIAPEFPAKDAPAAQAALRTLADHPANLRKPLGYEASKSEMAAARQDTPSNAFDYGKRAGFFVDQGMRKEALADYGKAIELDPNNVWAWSNRAITRIQEGDLVGARADLDKAEALDPTYIQVFIGRGMLADHDHRPKDAIDAYTKALQREPDNGYALTQRAEAYAALGELDKTTADRIALADADVAANPDTASYYLVRANMMLDLSRFDDAIRDLDKVLSLEPKNATALADRAMARVWKGNSEAARPDLNAAAAIGSRNDVVLRVRGLIAQQKGLWRDAIADYSASLKIDPNSAFALGHRAEAQRAIGDSDAALRDAAAAIELQPSWVEMYLLRANILRSQGKPTAVLGEAAAMTTANPKNSYAYVAAANVYSALHRDADAMRAYDQALALEPEAYIYLNRSVRRPKADVAGRRADLDAALKLQPDFTDAIAEKAKLQADSGDLPGAISTYSAALSKSPDDPTLLTGRGIAYARSGNKAGADVDFERARGKMAGAEALNNICWAKATAGVALESALGDCNAALAKTPDVPAYLDSRGLVLLRLGRLDDAIADYDRALAASPAMASSQYGRAVAWARKGDRARSDADAAAAVKADTNVEANYVSYGITR